MTQDPSADWRQTETSARFSDPADCSHRANRLEKIVRRRNWIEYAAAGLVIAVFAAFAVGAIVIGQPGMAIGAAMIVAATVFVVRHLARRGKFGAANPADSCAQFLRTELARQRDLLRGVPKWYLAPFVPGMATIFGTIAYAVAQEAGWSVALRGLAQPLAGAVAIFGLVALANHIGARKLDREIEALDALA